MTHWNSSVGKSRHFILRLCWLAQFRSGSVESTSSEFLSVAGENCGLADTTARFWGVSLLLRETVYALQPIVYI